MKRAWLIGLCFLSQVAVGKDLSSSDATNAIVGEAAGEPYAVKLGVACAIRNRGSLRGVYGFQSPVTRHSSLSVWNDAARAWRESANPHVVSPARTANHFGSAADVRKGTFRGMTLLCVLGTGKHATYFFRP